MATVNIRRDVDDKFYRYKMPVLQTKIEGKGNGIKTVIPNMSAVASALSRPPLYPTKFFGAELGAQTKFEDKNDRYIVNGAHDANRLRELLDVFIAKFVLCGKCKNPETDLVITKSEDVLRDCKACGATTLIDMRHKLTSFIIKNPPEVKTIKGLKKGGENTPAANAQAALGSTKKEKAEEGEDETGEENTQANAEIDESEIPDVGDRGDDDDDWAVDTSPEAVAAREKELAAQLKSSMILGGQDGDDDEEEDQDSPYFQFKTWIVESKEAAGIESLDSAKVYEKAKELGVEKKHKAVCVIAEVLFTENAVKEIPKFSKVLKKMISSEKHQKALLGGTERLVGNSFPDTLLPQVPKLLMAYYQLDVLDEEVAKNWGTHVSKKYTDKETSKKVRKASEPFLKWLETADESEEESE